MYWNSKRFLSRSFFAMIGKRKRINGKMARWKNGNRATTTLNDNLSHRIIRSFIITFVYLEPSMYVNGTSVCKWNRNQYYVLGTSICTWNQYVYLVSAYLPGTIVCKWNRSQYTYEEPVYLPGTSMCSWHQHMYLEPAYVNGTSLCTWNQCIAAFGYQIYAADCHWSICLTLIMS